MVCRWCEVIIKTCSWFWFFLCCNKFLHWGNCRGRPIDPTVNTPTVIALTVITPTGNPTCCVIARNSSGANRDGWQGTRRHGWRPPRVWVCVCRSDTIGLLTSRGPEEAGNVHHRDTLCFLNEYLYRNTRLLRDKENPLDTGVPDIHQFTPFTKITLNLKLSAAQYRLLMFMERQINIYSNSCTYLQIIKDRYKISLIQLEISSIDLKISSNELYPSANKHNWDISNWIEDIFKWIKDIFNYLKISLIFLKISSNNWTYLQLFIDRYNYLNIC